MNLIGMKIEDVPPNVRVVIKDGVSVDLSSMNYKEDRVNVEVKDGVIVRIVYEG